MDNVTYKIYPAIGIARVGSSDEYYLSPEQEGALPINLTGEPFKPEDFRDTEGKMKRQAARFQIYQVDEHNNATPLDLTQHEVTELKWTVHLANKKAIWYEFQTSFGEHGYAPNHPLRNPTVTDPIERRKLIIDPGPRQVSYSTTGSGQNSAEFDRASTQEAAENRFPPESLRPRGIDTLGGLRLDEQGHLHVLGGYGLSGTTRSYNQEDLKDSLPEYANNDDWFDDTADGPVTATLVINGREVEVEPAWVLVAPPAYAPEIVNLITLQDTIYDMSVRKMNAAPQIYNNGMWNKDFKPNFDTHIRPILERGQGYPWVVAIPPKPHKFKMEMLADPDPALNGLRQRILNYLRAPGDERQLISPSKGGTMMPYLAGDACIYDNNQTAKYLRLTDTQYFYLTQWANGYFEPGTATDNGNAGEQLTQGVLRNCDGGAFSPGIEMTWICRNAQIYSSPFRIRHKQNVQYPLALDWDLNEGLEPGDITKMMAIPWQADFNECADQPIDGRTLWWWPAQRPLYVYEKQKDIVEPRNTIQEYVAAGEIKQKPWIGTDYDMKAADFVRFAENFGMVEKWSELDFILNEGDHEHPLFVTVAMTKAQTDTAPATEEQERQPADVDEC